MYITAKEAALKWGISERRVRVLCAENRIAGAFCINGVWCIPQAAAKPADARKKEASALLRHPGELLLQMEEGLKKGEFFVVYQPQYDHSTGLVTGAEALARWQSPDNGLLSPSSFIPQMEANGLIIRLDLFIFACVCRMLRQCLSAGIRPVPISVNASRIDISRPDFIDALEAIRKEYGIDPHLLRIEITESIAINGVDWISAVVARLHALGYLVEMDDFGSGYSSLNILREIPFDVLKLDMQFLNGSSGGRGGIILTSVVRMAKWLQMPVIAEGVETLTQADYLRSIGCTQVQGYFYARPLETDRFIALIRATPGAMPEPLTKYAKHVDPSRFWDFRSESNAFFDAIAGPSVIFSVEPDRHWVEIVRVNRRFVDMLGMNLTEHELLGTDPRSTMDAAMLEKFRSALSEVAETGEETTVEIRHTLRSGCCGEDDVWIRYHLELIGRNSEELSYYAYADNITMEKQSAQHLLDKEKNFRAASEQANIYFWEYTVATREMRPCFRCMRDLGLPPLVKNYPEPTIECGIIPPDYAEMYRDWHRRIAAGETDLEAVIPLTVGRVPFHVRYTTEFDEAGRPVKAYGSATLVVD